jgi:hypothetical protein
VTVPFIYCLDFKIPPIMASLDPQTSEVTPRLCPGLLFALAIIVQTYEQRLRK